MFRRVLICFAFATCCFLSTWTGVAQQNLYLVKYDPLQSVIIPAICCEAVLVGAMLAAWAWVRRGRHFLFLLACLLPLLVVSVALVRMAPFAILPLFRQRIFWAGGLAASLAPVAFAVRNPRAASRIAREVLLYSTPVLAFVLIQAARASLLKYPGSAYADGPLATAVHTGAPPRIRVVWIVFDELSQTTAYARRPSGLMLPEFDRMKSESFYSTLAMAPSDNTARSVPALITGERVVKAEPDGPSNMLLTFAGRAAKTPWSDVRNVFDDAREIGVDTALVGWFHPYGRLLNRSLTRCDWVAVWRLPEVEEPSAPESLPARMWFRVEQQLSIPAAWAGAPARERMIERFQVLRHRAAAVVSDPSIGLALIHVPAPHPPPIYDRKTQSLTARRGTSYLDNLALADRTLGELRRAMESAGVWDRTFVLVSADHGWRSGMWRNGVDWTAEDEAAAREDTAGVPFLVRIPHRNEPFVYQKRFNTVVSRHVITQILRGSITDAPGMAAVIDAQPTEY